MKFLILKIVYSDWRAFLIACDRCICIKENEISKYNATEYKIMPICVDDYIKYNSSDHSIFRNNLDTIEILDNKSKFGKYMSTKFPFHIPVIYYYHFDNETFNNEYQIPLPAKLIQKPNKSSGGGGIKVHTHDKVDLSETKDLKNCIIQKFIEHRVFYVGHFLVLNGVIRRKIYFNAKWNGVLRGAISNYKVEEVLSDGAIDDGIFANVFNDLTFSGFASADFIIVNNVIIVFEINPRIGGSLVKNKDHFNMFMETLNDSIDIIST